MQRLVMWLKANKLALIVSTLMFAVMATVMAVMLDKDFFGNIGDVLSEDATDMMSPFLWVWRIGGMVTWPVFYLLLFRPFHDPNSQESTMRMLLVAIAGMLYGGLGMWATNLISTALVSFLAYGASTSQASSLLTLVGWLLVDMLSIAYTWGFCAIYAVALKSFVGRQDNNWILVSIGFTMIGRWLGPLLISFLIVVILDLILIPFSSFGLSGFLIVAIPIAIALSTGNFAGQWLAFWKVHDHVLGIAEADAMRQRQLMAQYAYDHQGMPTQLYPYQQMPTSQPTQPMQPMPQMPQQVPAYPTYPQWQQPQPPVADVQAGMEDGQGGSYPTA